MFIDQNCFVPLQSKISIKLFVSNLPVSVQSFRSSKNPSLCMPHKRAIFQLVNDLAGLVQDFYLEPKCFLNLIIRTPVTIKTRSRFFKS
jgi:hypothetical protein